MDLGRLGRIVGAALYCQEEDAVVELSVGGPNDGSVPVSESGVITFSCYGAKDIYHLKDRKKHFGR